MSELQIKKTIECLSSVIEVSEEKKQELLSKFTSMSDKDAIKELSQIAYRILSTDTDLFDYALTVIRNINPDICPPIEEMKIKLHKMFSNEIEGNMSIEDNHKIVIETLVYFTKLFNQYGIDYYIVGALPCFLKTGIPLFRYHDDIDIMVNEDDLSKVAEIIELSGYQFQDDRFPTIERYQEMQSKKPPHTVLAQNADNEFHLGFFCFRREPDNSITMREYSHRLENDRVITDVLERRSDPVGTTLRYDDEATTYLDTSFRTSSPESVYSLKMYTRRPKDITDTQKLEPFINRELLEELKNHPNNNVEIYDIRDTKTSRKKI